MYFYTFCTVLLFFSAAAIHFGPPFYAAAGGMFPSLEYVGKICYTIPMPAKEEGISI